MNESNQTFAPNPAPAIVAAASTGGAARGDNERNPDAGLNLRPSGRGFTSSRLDGSGIGQTIGTVTVVDPVFSCRDVDVHYGAKHAIKSVSLDVGKQQVLAMIGPSGCGKSTFLRCLNRMNDTIAVRPEVILFDEPTAALDPISTLRVEETLQSLREQYCIAIVTHNLQQAARVSNTTAFMYLGELVEVGPADQIFTAPKDRRTDDYVTGRFG
jgi:ABC-type phosphate transport system ATPase subunit